MDANNQPCTRDPLFRHFDFLPAVFAADCDSVRQWHRNWLENGTTAFDVLSKAWTRIEDCARWAGYDVFKLLLSFGDVLDQIRQLRRCLLHFDAVHGMGSLDIIDDPAVLYVKDTEYRASWKKRGGVSAFMMLARKWDRLEAQVRGQTEPNLVWAVQVDKRPEGVWDDIRDLRRYLLLVEAEAFATGIIK